MTDCDQSTEKTPLLGNSSAPSVTPKNTDVEESPTQGETFSFISISRRKKLILVCMAFVNFSAAVCFSLLAPFFPREAGMKGASPTVVGMIFGAFELIIFISSPIYGNYLTKIGSKFMFTSGIMVCGTCAILFGLLDKCPDGNIFIVMCFLSRSIEALGASAFVTSLFAVLANEFPDHVITVLGSLETFGGIGMMVGPPIGGALYELGGYGLPFFVLGSSTILVGLGAAVLMPSTTDVKKRYSGSVLTLLKSPLVVITFINIAAGSISLGFMDPTLANHLAQFDLSTLVIGVMFLIAPAVYAVTAPVWGYIGDKKGIVNVMICCGSFGSVVAIVVLGPVPVLPFIPNELYVKVIALTLIGLFVGCAIIPTFKALVNGAMSLGMPDNLETYGKVSGFFNSSFSLGAFLGPTVGGVLVDNFGFDWSCGAVACSFLFAGSLMFVYTCIAGTGKTLPSQSSTADESSAIVVANNTHSNVSEIQNNMSTNSTSTEQV